MNDIVAIQYAIFRGLQSCALFDDYNIVLGREFLVASAVAQDAIWLTAGKTGKSGLGLIVQIPALLMPKPNSLQREREFSVGIYEERNANFAPPANPVVSGAEDVFLNGEYTKFSATRWRNTTGGNLWYNGIWFLGDNAQAKYWDGGDASGYPYRGVYGVQENGIGAAPTVAGYPGGTLTQAEDVADSVIDFLWNWRLWRTSGLVPAERAVVPDPRFEGVAGFRAVVTLRQERAQPARCALPAIAAQTNGSLRTITLTVADGSDIYYTTDGFSLPSPKTDGSLPGETAAVKYSAPFDVAAGTIVMAAAWPPSGGGNAPLPSQTNNQLIT